MYPNTYEGSERIFHFEHPGASEYSTGQTCTVTLESDCGDLTLAALEWNVNTNGCPEYGSYTTGCEWSNTIGDGNEEILFYDYNQASYLIIVDSQYPVDANFRISVACSVF